MWNKYTQDKAMKKLLLAQNVKEYMMVATCCYLEKKMTRLLNFI